MNAIRQTLILPVAALAALGCTAAWADPAGCGSVTSTQRRIVERADEGMPALRTYVQVTSFTRGVNMTDVKSSLDTWRAVVSCQREVAAAKAAQETARADAPAAPPADATQDVASAGR